jgi:hypothetical protein
MASQIYKTEIINLVDGTKIILSPLKIKYLRRFMDAFEFVKTSNNDIDSISYLSNCALIAMQQYYPNIKTIEQLEDNIDLPTIYKIINIAGSIEVDSKSDKSVKEQALKPGTGGATWGELDLAKLESEIFLLGIWKDYNELEEKMSMPELIITLSAYRELDYQEKKFFAAIQGVDLDKETRSSRGQKEWEDMKARVFSKGQASDSKDILALQGPAAEKAGFGIGMGIDYEDMRDMSLMKDNT